MARRQRQDVAAKVDVLEERVPDAWNVRSCRRTAAGRRRRHQLTIVVAIDDGPDEPAGNQILVPDVVQRLAVEALDL